MIPDLRYSFARRFVHEGDADSDPYVLLLACCLEAMRKPFPLISNKPIEASTTVKEGSVEIEYDGVDIRSHLV